MCWHDEHGSESVNDGIVFGACADALDLELEQPTSQLSDSRSCTDGKRKFVFLAESSPSIEYQRQPYSMSSIAMPSRFDQPLSVDRKLCLAFQVSGRKSWCRTAQSTWHAVLWLWSLDKKDSK